MPKPTKRLQKPSPEISSASSTIPAPFTPAPSTLLPFLDTLSKTSVYITHLDHHPARFKRRIFTIPILLNLSILILLLWRTYIQVPFYWKLFLSVVGHHNEYTINTKAASWSTLARQIVWRAANFLFDWVFARIIAPWPWTFFCERPGNPTRWRWNVGFRDTEVYVRVSRGWGRDDLLGASREEVGGGGGGRSKEKRKAGGESPFFKVRILPAVDPNRVREKTGYLLMDADWDLDFAAMVQATKSLDQGVLKEVMLEKSVFVWCPSPGQGEDVRAGQWAVWECWKLDEGAEGEGRKKIVAFRDRLAAMGKENLFFKWIELIQFESSRPGGFTPERQVEAARKAKMLFQEQGVDFDGFVKDIGGLEGLPGYETPE